MQAMLIERAVDSRHRFAFEERHLAGDERVVAVVAGYTGKMMGSGKDRPHNGVLVLTDRRVVFYRKGLLGEKLETMPLAKVTSIEASSTMGFRLLRIHTSHDDLVFRTTEGREFIDQVRRAIEDGRDQAKAPAVAPAAPTAAHPLEQLAALHRQGLLTDEEFAAKRAEVIARL